MSEDKHEIDIEEWVKTVANDGVVTFDPIERGWFCKLGISYVAEQLEKHEIEVVEGDFDGVTTEFGVLKAVLDQLDPKIAMDHITQTIFQVIAKDNFVRVNKDFYMKISRMEFDQKEAYRVQVGFSGEQASSVAQFPGFEKLSESDLSEFAGEVKINDRSYGLFESETGYMVRGENGVFTHATLNQEQYCFEWEEGAEIPIADLAGLEIEMLNREIVYANEKQYRIEVHGQEFLVYSIEENEDVPEQVGHGAISKADGVEWVQRDMPQEDASELNKLLMIHPVLR